MIVVLFTGSRTWDKPDLIYAALDAETAGHLQAVLVHGACSRGGDKIADEWARSYVNRRRVIIRRFPALWLDKDGKLNRAAGYARNARMVRDGGADVCVSAIRDGSRGATHCTDRARRAGIRIRTVEYT